LAITASAYLQSIRTMPAQKTNINFLVIDGKAAPVLGDNAATVIAPVVAGGVASAVVGMSNLRQ
jgi:hypothetical protein